MAENETLHLLYRSGRRWLALARLIAEGAPRRMIQEKAVSNLCKTLRNISSDEPIGHWLRAAAGESGSMEELVRDCRKHRQYAQLFALEAHMGLGREALAETVLRAIADVFLDQIGLHLMNGKRDFGAVAVRVGECRRVIEEPVRELARRWARNPDKAPRRPQVPQETSVAKHKELLRTSLLRD